MFNEQSLLNKIIEIRSYKKQSGNYKTIESKIHKNKMEMKRVYALPQRPKKIEKGFDKMWGYIQKKERADE